MKRLRDEAPLHPVVARAQALLAQVEPVAKDPSRRARVRARLVHRSRTRFLRPVVVGILLVGGAAMASTLAVKVYQRVSAPVETPKVIHSSESSASASASASSSASSFAPVRVMPPAKAEPRKVAAGPTEEESALMMQAVQALRRDHDAERAGALLDDYLRRFEHGALEEEALALAVEAAAARGDERAGELGERYLARYPKGRFRQAAERARERFGK